MSAFDLSDRPFESLDFRSKALNQFASHMYELTATLELGVGFDSREHGIQAFPHVAKQFQIVIQPLPAHRFSPFIFNPISTSRRMASERERLFARAQLSTAFTASRVNRMGMFSVNRIPGGRPIDACL
jgi:hypothetical protein